MILDLLNRFLNFIARVYRNDPTAFITGMVMLFIAWYLSYSPLYWIWIAYMVTLALAEKNGEKIELEKAVTKAIDTVKAHTKKGQVEPVQTISAGTTRAITTVESDTTPLSAAPDVKPDIAGEPVKDKAPTDIKPVGVISADVKPVEPKSADVNKPEDKSIAGKVDSIIKKSVTFTGAFLSEDEQKKEEALDISKIDAAIRMKIKGQDHAITSVIGTLKRAASGIRIKAESPLCVFLFMGATGTGKTEIVKQIAEATGRPLVRLDMPNYSTEAGLWELIGSPAGYVGSDKPGRLTGEIRNNPNAVLLLDEIEKATPKIWDPFLRVLDEGKLKDQSKGFTVDFKNVLIFLTSNLLQMDEHIEDEAALRNKILNEGYFRPELLNRIDRIVMFKPFTSAIMGEIIANMLVRFSERFMDTNKINAEVSIDRSVIELVLSKIDLKFGVRDAERFIDKHAGDALAEVFLHAKQTGKQITSITLKVTDGKMEVEL